jgi:hypothetical protein
MINYVADTRRMSVFGTFGAMSGVGSYWGKSGHDANRLLFRQMSQSNDLAAPMLERNGQIRAAISEHKSNGRWTVRLTSADHSITK